MFDKLVFSGGANRGFCYIGVLKSLEDNKLCNFKTVMGTSVGSIFATFVAMKFNSAELLKYLNYKLNFFDIDINDFVTNYGFYKGDEICEKIKEIIKLKYDENITLKDLYKKTRIELIITSLCLEDKKIVYLSYKKFPNMKIIDAIRFSISIPFIFTVKKYKNKHYIDAALIDNISINYFNESDKVLGIKLNGDCSTNENIESLNKYISILYSCISSNLKKDITKYKIINININDDIINDPIDFELDISKIKYLINLGYQNTNLFIKKNN